MSRQKRIATIDLWVQDFQVFVGFYATRFPQEASGFKKYGVTIQDLTTLGHNCLLYDKNFRFLCQTPTTSIP